MIKIKNIAKGGLLSVLAALVLFAPVFADECTPETIHNSNSNLYVMESGGSTDSSYPVRCATGTLTYEGSSHQITIYGKSSGDCASAGTFLSNPSSCNSSGLNEIINTIINTIIFVVGILAVIMIVLGGISYATSQGDPGKVKKAKDTILYGIIGLVIALLAFAIVSFVLNALQN